MKAMGLYNLKEFCGVNEEEECTQN